MDKRDKKRSEVLKTRLVKLRQLLAAAKSQPDDVDEIRKLEKEIADATAELAKLKD
jgi:ribosomal protein L29